jgi:hypothetical protein
VVGEIECMKTIYIDTSVFGGNFDEEFSYWNQKFFDRVLKSKYVLIYSDVAERELEGAPDKVREFVETIPKKCIRRIELTTLKRQYHFPKSTLMKRSLEKRVEQIVFILPWLQL